MRYVVAILGSSLALCACATGAPATCGGTQESALTSADLVGSWKTKGLRLTLFPNGMGTKSYLSGAPSDISLEDDLTWEVLQTSRGPDLRVDVVHTDGSTTPHYFEIRVWCASKKLDILELRGATNKDVERYDRY